MAKTIASRKAKGRALQQYVAGEIKKRFGLDEDDVKSTPMGSSGVDIQLSKQAKFVFPYKIECKNQEGFAKIYNAYEQADKQKGTETPIVVLKSNRKKILVVLSFEDFMKLADS